MPTKPQTATSQPPRDAHGCNVSGWSNAGAHLRAGVRRIYLAAHGDCHFCGGPLDQYGECGECV